MLGSALMALEFKYDIIINKHIQCTVASTNASRLRHMQLFQIVYEGNGWSLFAEIIWQQVDFF